MPATFSKPPLPSRPPPPKEGGRGEPPKDGTLVPLEIKLCERARDFSLPALLDVLHFLGYRSDDIEFRGHMSQARPSSLIQAVEFLKPRTSGRRAVKVTVNLGLLSAQSPLPSYFLKIAEKLEGESLVDFLGFFDHHLLKHRALSLYPERDRTIFADWEQAQGELLQLVGLGAPSTLYWLCERIFPELSVRVERSTAQKPLKAQGAVLGHAVLGEGCAFGGGTSVPVGGIDITLYSEETETPTGVPWPAEAARRMREQLFAVLGESELYLTIYLVMLEQENWLKLQEDRFLGHEPIWDPSRRAAFLPPAAPLPPAGRKGPTGAREKAGTGPAASQLPSQGRTSLGPLPDLPTSTKPFGRKDVSEEPTSPSSLQEAPSIPRDGTARSSTRIQQIELFSGPVKRARE